MKRVFVPSLFAALFAMVGCSDKPGTTKNELQVKNDSLTAIIKQRDADMDNMLECIRVVEEGFSKINEAQGRISVTGDSDLNRKEKLQNDVEYIVGQLEKNSEYIAKLKKMVAGNEKASKELKRIIENLEKQVEAKNEELVALHGKLKEKDIVIEELNVVIEDLTKQNTEQELRIVEKDKKINTVWYVIGTKKELKNENILSGGDVLLKPGANMEYFTAVDKNNVTEIKTHAKKAKLLSAHPDGSYTLEKDDEGMKVLRITDIQAFWSITRHLVIQVY